MQRAGNLSNWGAFLQKEEEERNKRLNEIRENIVNFLLTCFLNRCQVSATGLLQVIAEC